MSQSSRCARRLLCQTTHRPAFTPVKSRGLVTDSSSDEVQAPFERPLPRTRNVIGDAVQIYQLQSDLASPVDTLKRIFLGPTVGKRAATINARHGQQSHRLLGVNPLTIEERSPRSEKYQRKWIQHEEVIESFQSLVSAQIAACKSPPDILRVVVCATGPLNQALQQEALRREALQRLNVQGLILQRLKRLEIDKNDPRQKLLFEKKNGSKAVRARKIRRRKLNTLFCLNTIISRLQNIGVEIQAPILVKGWQMSASIHSLSTFRLYSRKLSEISFFETTPLDLRISRSILRYLLHGYSHRASDTTQIVAQQMQEILFGSGLHASELNAKSPSNLRGLLHLKDPELLHIWLALVRRCRASAKEQLGKEWQLFKEYSFLSEKDRGFLIGSFISQFCLAGHPDAAWRIFQEEGGSVPLNYTAAWSLLLYNADHKPELKEKSLEALLGNQWIKILGIEMEKLEKRLGLEWAADTQDGGQASGSSTGHHLFVPDGLLELLMRNQEIFSSDLDESLKSFSYELTGPRSDIEEEQEEKEDKGQEADMDESLKSFSFERTGTRSDIEEEQEEDDEDENEGDRFSHNEKAKSSA